MPRGLSATDRPSVAEISSECTILDMPEEEGDSTSDDEVFVGGSSTAVFEGDPSLGADEECASINSEEENPSLGADEEPES